LDEIKSLIPLSAISFCSTSFHKKDVAAIGANFETIVFLGWRDNNNSNQYKTAKAYIFFVKLHGKN